MNPPETLTPHSRAVNFAGTRATRHSRAGAILPPPRARCSSSLRCTARSPVHQGAPPRAAATGGARTRGCHSTSSAAATFSDSPYHSGVAVCGPMVIPAADRRATVGARAAGRGLVDTGADDSGCRPPSARHPAGKPTRGSARRRKAALRLGPSNAARSDGPRTRLLAGTGAAAVTGASGAVADAVRPDRFRPGQTRGRGAPLAQRLFVEVLTAVHVGDRAPEWITAPPITLRDLFKVFLAAASGAGEHFLQTRLRLPLPAADLVRMYFVLGRDRLDRVVPAQRFSRYLGFELRCESASFRRHSVGPPHGLEYTLTS